jgi:hypothetical protein
VPAVLKVRGKVPVVCVGEAQPPAPVQFEKVPSVQEVVLCGRLPTQFQVIVSPTEMVVGQGVLENADVYGSVGGADVDAVSVTEHDERDQGDHRGSELHRHALPANCSCLSSDGLTVERPRRIGQREHATEGHGRFVACSHCRGMISTNGR